MKLQTVSPRRGQIQKQIGEELDIKNPGRLDKYEENIKEFILRILKNSSAQENSKALIYENKFGEEKCNINRLGFEQPKNKTWRRKINSSG